MKINKTDKLTTYYDELKTKDNEVKTINKTKDEVKIKDEIEKEKGNNIDTQC